MTPVRIVSFIVATVAVGLLLSQSTAQPARAASVTISSPDTIADSGSAATAGVTITGTAEYYAGYLPDAAAPTSGSIPEVSCFAQPSSYYAQLKPGSPYGASAISVDGSCLVLDDNPDPAPVVMDSGDTQGDLRGGWSLFVPAAAFSRDRPLDGLHTFGVFVFVVTVSDSGSVTYQVEDSILKDISVVHSPDLPSQTPSSSEQPRTASPSPTSTPEPTATGTSTPIPATASKLGTGTPDADSVYSALRPVGDITITPTSALVLAAVTLILLLLIGFPGVLVESTVSKHYDELFPWRRRAQEKPGDAGSPAKVATWITVTLGVAVATIISGFIDPQFGLNPGSARVLLSSAVVFVLLSVIGWLMVEWVIHSTDPTLRPSIEFKWLSLLVVALAVLLSRLTGFEPGIVFGLVVGLSFGAALTTVQNARTVLVGVAYAVILGLGGWLAYSAVKPLLEQHPSVGSQFVLDLLAGVAVAGMSTLPIALLPITGLGGAAVFSWNKWVWAIAYATGLAIFFVVLMPLPESWGEVSLALIVWVILYSCFAVGAIIFWAYFRIKDGRQAAEPAQHGK